MANEDKKTGGNKDSVLGEIIIYAVLIIIMLIFLLRIVDRVGQETDQKTVNPQPAADTVSSAEKNPDEIPVSLIQPPEDREPRDTDRIMEQLQGIVEYIKANQNSITESDVRKIKEELEQFRKNLEPYPKMISEKLDRIAALVEKQERSKVIYTAAAPGISKKRNPDTGKKISAQKAEPVPIRQEIPKIRETEVPVAEKKEIRQTEKPITPTYPDIREEKPPVFTVSESMISGEEKKKIIQRENEGISGKTLCQNSPAHPNTVHFLSNQVLVRLVSVYFPDRWNAGSAMIDITHPRLGLRRFAEMEEGTTRPFEYGRKTYFLELLKLHGDCADVAVYERKRS